MNLMDWLSAHGVEFTDAGEDVRICCPLCGESKFKCYLHLTRNMAHCFRCEESGSVKTFLKAIGDITNLGDIKPRVLKLEKRPELLKREIVELPCDAKPIWIDHGSVMQKMGLTYLREKRNISLDVIKEARIHYGTDAMRGYLIFPVHDEYDRLVSWHGRRFWRHGPKAINPPDSQKFLYNLNRIIGESAIALVEGPYDTLSLTPALREIGCGVAGLLGHHLTHDLAATIKYLVGAVRVYVMMDGDAVGQAAEPKIASTLLQVGIEEVYRCNLLDSDPDELGSRVYDVLENSTPVTNIPLELR